MDCSSLELLYLALQKPKRPFLITSQRGELDIAVGSDDETIDKQVGVME